MDAAAVDHALSGSVSSMGVFALLYPLDVARTRQQARSKDLNDSKAPKAKVSQDSCDSMGGVLAVLSGIVEQDGWRGLYVGLSANIVSIGVSQALYFFFYEFIKRLVISVSNRGRRRRQLPATSRTTLVQDLGIAFVSGMINATVTCPMWVTATRLKLASLQRQQRQHEWPPPLMQSADNDTEEEQEKDGFPDDEEPPTFVQSFAEVLRSGDAWKGLGPSLILCSNPALQYGIYEQLKQQVLLFWARRRAGRVAGGVLNPVPAFIIGAVAKTVATIFTYPLQLVQTRTREEGFSGGMWEAFQLLIAESGMRISPFFRGMTSKLLMTVLNASLMFMTKEWMLRMVLKGKRILSLGS